MYRYFLPTLLSLGLSACGGSSGGGAATPTPPSVDAPSINENWQLVWSDEFNGDTIDNNKWSHEKNCTGGGNNELQCYTDREQNSFVADGQLHIVARQESFSGQSQSDDSPDYDPEDTSATRSYTSARLRTKTKGDWRYGRMEISARLPQGQGIWPAIWMLPTEWKYGAWPASGEIDIMEAVNSNTGSNPNDIHGTLHYGKFWPENTYSGQAKTVQGNAWEGQHIYAVEWERDEIRWYVDGSHYATQRPATTSSNGWFTYYWQGQTEGYSYGPQGAPFDEQFHLILNLAVGGNWPGNPNTSTQFPQTFSIDYVRVYQCAPNGIISSNGSGCGSNIDADIDAIGSPRPAQKTFSLYNAGLSDVPLTSDGINFTQTLSLGSWAAVDGDVEIASINADEGALWQTTFYGAGTSFINIDASPITNTDTGLQFVNMAQYSELRFDLKIISTEPSTSFKIKLDDGSQDLLQYTINTPPTNQWTRISVPLSQMQGNSAVDFSAVQKPFIIEASGPAKIQVDRIELICLDPCNLAPVSSDTNNAITETISIFDDEVNSRWNLGILIWEEQTPHLLVDVVDASEAEHGKVIDVTFSAENSNGLVFIQADSSQNMNAFASNGLLQFDINVQNYAAATSINIKADCTHPCSSGDINIGQPGMNGWQTVQVPVSDLVAGGLDLSKVNTPFALLPRWTEQAGVHLQLDNILWLRH